MHVGIILFASVVYICLLFLIAKFADLKSDGKRRPQPMRYALIQAVFCSSWTFLGAIGLAATGRMEFLGVYLGPFILYTVARPLLRRIIKLSKIEKTSSLADFIATRYGKNIWVGSLVSFVAFVGALPFIVMQIKAISSSIAIIEQRHNEFEGFENVITFDVPLLLIIALAAFIVIFGSKNIDGKDNRQGLLTVVAYDAAFKFIAVVVLSFFILYGIFNGLADFLLQVLDSERFKAMIQHFNWAIFLLIGLFSFMTTILLPRQFHVAVVENFHPSELDRAVIIFPIYLVVINLFIFIISAAALIHLPASIDPNYLFLSIPIIQEALWIQVLLFWGCLSAVTASVIIAVLALTLMLTKSLFLPIMLKNENWLNRVSKNNIPQFMKNLRSLTIIFIFVCAYIFYRLVGDYATLASSGLLAFVAFAQLAPAMYGGLFWRRATAKAAFAGISSGFCVWVLLLLLPVVSNFELFDMLGLSHWRFTNDVFVNGGLYSIVINTLAFIGVSFLIRPTALEKEQAELFVSNGRRNSKMVDLSTADLRVGELCTTIAQYLGKANCEKAFAGYSKEAGREINMDDQVDTTMLQHAENVLAGGVGAASARLILALLIQRGSANANAETFQLLGDASKALKENRDILRRALDQVDQAISVFNVDLKLTNWNKQFREMLNLPKQYGEIGRPLDQVIEAIIKHNKLSIDLSADELLSRLKTFETPWVLEFIDKDVSIEILSNGMPDGGLVISWNDISDKVRDARILHHTNENLERSVEKRTEELTAANEQLAIATQTAQEANLSKTRFLAAAGHDILQPLNAARLYTSTLLERAAKEGGEGKLEQNILDSLSSVEDILDAVISISKLDSGSMQPTLNYFSVEKLFSQLQVEFSPIAKSKNVELKFVQSTLWVRSDANFLRRILQNLISNGIKYAPNGKVLVGCRRKKNSVIFQILDNGIGITEEEQKTVFSEFTRLDSGAKVAAGLGLGLSIVARVAKVLKHPLTLESQKGMGDDQKGSGSKFSLTVPIAASLSRRMDGNALRRPKRRVDIADMKILCIDNEQGILDGMELLLKEWDCDVLTALSEEAALKILKEQEGVIDFIIADYHLDNDKTGIDAVVAIREYYKVPIPAVLATADRSEEVQENAARTELSILRKPVKPAALRALLASRRKRRSPQEITL